MYLMCRLRPNSQGPASLGKVHPSPQGVAVFKEEMEEVSFLCLSSTWLAWSNEDIDAWCYTLV